jgi:hypothetical protein
MPERHLTAYPRVAPCLRQLRLQTLYLRRHRLHLRVRLLAVGEEGGDLVLRPGHVTLDLLAFITPQGGLEAGFGGRISAETENFTAVRHTFHPHIRIVPWCVDTHRVGTDHAGSCDSSDLGSINPGKRETSQAAPEKLRYGLFRH